LGLLALGVTALTGGALIAWRLFDGSGEPSWTVVFASTTLVVGTFLLIGTFFGRARWLIIPGILLLLATSAASAVDAFLARPVRGTLIDCTDSHEAPPGPWW
jgi:hypothetical protein